MDLGLADARIVVTGGASNIGRGIVHAFAAEGARVVINDIDEPQAEKVRTEAKELGAAEVDVVIADLTKPGAAETVVDAARTAWGGLDVLVNNAGWSVPGFVATDTDRDKWQRTIEINLFSAIATARQRRPWWHSPALRRVNTAAMASDPMSCVPASLSPMGPRRLAHLACGRSDWMKFSIKSRSTSCSRTPRCVG